MNTTLSAERWRYMVTTGLWPKKANFDPAAWLSNFNADELPLAQRLLEGFTFFSDELVKQMFRSAFIDVSKLVVTHKDEYPTAQCQWARFVDSIVVVRVTGEVPRDADSGFTFARLARDVLQVPEERIIGPELSLSYLARGGEGNVLFVDDFVGSGNQFCDTWERLYATDVGEVSFKELTSQASCKARFFYCPVVCTETGRKNISQRCGNVVQIAPAHFFGSAQSVHSENSAIWREDMRTEGPEFVRTASARAGIPYLNGGEGCWMGFHKLGLALAFSHGYPDATIPLFYSTNNNWQPLIRKGTL